MCEAERLYLENAAGLNHWAVVGEKAIVLASGGMDSAVALAVAKRRAFDVHVMAFEYGQRHLEAEMYALQRVRIREGVSDDRFHRVRLELGALGGSALTDMRQEVPKDRDRREIGSGVPITYVPARNILFLSHALALGEVIGARRIFIGAHAMDSSGYPDCRQKFLDAFEMMAHQGMKTDDWRIEAPLITLSKSRIVSLGLLLGVDFSLTHSCYDPVATGMYPVVTRWISSADAGRPDWRACGRCDSCKLRREGFECAGVPDPTRYA